MEYSEYSVLMSVYQSENPNNLKKALESILNQTHRPNEIVLVEDGPLTDDLYKIISDYLSYLKIIKIPTNVGLGNALNLGLESCSNELVMRMDTDDYSVPDRAEKMLLKFNQDNNIDVLGSSINEFSDDISNVISRKPVLLKDTEIKKRLKYRNPINHPSVMFKKNSVLEVGGYQEIKYNEDYFLWIRMAINDKKFLNFEEPLVYMRVDNDSYARRHGYNYFKYQKTLFKYMKKNNFINNFEYIFNISNRFFTKVLLPPRLMKYFYLSFLREKN